MTTKGNKYKEALLEMCDQQLSKGIRKYHMTLEENLQDIDTRIHYLQEELIDAFMYCEWIKDYLHSIQNDQA